jgi:hypothetical protein
MSKFGVDFILLPLKSIKGSAVHHGLSLKNDINVPLKSKKQKNLQTKIIFC